MAIKRSSLSSGCEDLKTTSLAYFGEEFRLVMEWAAGFDGEISKEEVEVHYGADADDVDQIDDIDYKNGQ